MTTPHHHHVTVTIPGVKQMRGHVLTVKQLGLGVANLVVEMPDVLPTGEYEATYTTTSQEAKGTFKVFGVSISSNYRWRAGGLFARDRRWRYPSKLAP